MKERPMLFSSSMVRAILAGTKTQTRRTVKPMKSAPLPDDNDPYTFNGAALVRPHAGGQFFVPLPPCPYGMPGDRLWVRETWAQYPVEMNPEPCDWWYRATRDVLPPGQTKWKPSIFMPREASRITLEVVSVRVERLQEISEADALAEGVSSTVWADSFGTHPADSAVSEYSRLWESINGTSSWDANPWVWVVSFRRVT